MTTKATNGAKQPVKPKTPSAAEQREELRKEAYASIAAVHDDAVERLGSLAQASNVFAHVHGDDIKQSPGYALFARAYADLNETRNRLAGAAREFGDGNPDQEDA